MFNDGVSIWVRVKDHVAININHLVLVIRSYNRVVLSDKQINQLVSVVIRNMVLPTHENVQKHKEYVNRRRLCGP